ncbi:MAG: hypothetical protein HQM08_16385 [Candidatus Riflebacteria bacterium]|nr:hypothetical protein [Candidatus Riflebacteria bacterium]
MRRKKSKTKIILQGVFGIFLLFLPGILFSQIDESLVTKIERSENFVFGKKFEGSALERVQRLEKELLGQKSEGELVTRIQNLFNFIFIGTSKSPSLDMKLKFLEWKSFRETKEGPLSDRLRKLDEFATGQSSNEPYAFRIEQLIQMTIEKGVLPLRRVKVSSGTALRVKVGKTVSSGSAKEGDEVPLIVLDDYFVDGVLAVAKGCMAIGDLDQVRKAGRFARPGRLKFVVRKANAIDGTSLPAALKEVAMSDLDKQKVGMAFGASTVGYLVMGPVGLVGGIFVKGKDVTLPEGTELIISVTEDTLVNGVLANRK